MVGSYAGWCYSEDQQGSGWVTVLHKAVLPGQEKWIPDSQKRKEYNQNMVWPLLEEHFVWLKTVHLEKVSKLENAVRHSPNKKQQLIAFLDYGNVPIS